MTETVTATFDSDTALKNAVNDLLAAGIPQEKFFVDKKLHQLKVITPKVGESEIMELLNRHHPQNMTERTWKH